MYWSPKLFKYAPINHRAFYLLSPTSINKFWQIMFVSNNLFTQTREESYHHHGHYHLHLLGLHLALRHHLHDAWQQTSSLAEGCYPAIQQQPAQPHPLHLHQQAGEEGHREDVHLPGAGAWQVCEPVSLLICKRNVLQRVQLLWWWRWWEDSKDAQNHQQNTKQVH